MRDADPFGDAAGVVDILPGAARPLLGQRRAVVIELQRHADDVIAFLGQHRRHDRAVDAPRHRHDHARLRRRLGEPQRVQCDAVARHRA